MNLNLSQVMADFDNNIQETPESKTTTKNRTLKRRPEPRLNKLKTTGKAPSRLSNDIYLDNSDTDQVLPNNKPESGSLQNDEPNENDYTLLGMGHPDNDYAEQKYKDYLNRYKKSMPLLDQSDADKVSADDSEYQQQYAPTYNQYQPPQQNYQNVNQKNNDKQNETLLKKLNYMIHLLEEQKNEQTNNVTEELILYIFLGIFVIFVVDSFTKVGKYTR